MGAARKIVRQSVSLPAGVANQLRSMARARKLSTSRMLVELVEEGMAARKRRQEEFLDLAERFRATEDPEEAKKLGDRLGRMVFGG